MGRVHEVVIALGSNQPGLGRSPLEILEAALDALGQAGLRVMARSRFYRSPAFPPGSGPPFVNAAARLECDRDPESILKVLHEVEAALGRTRTQRWEPRVCDLDLLAAGATLHPDAATVRRWMELPSAAQREVAPDRLILPHPRLHQRAFVLVPLAEVHPDWRHPLLGLSVREMLGALPDEARQAVEPI